MIDDDPSPQAFAHEDDLAAARRPPPIPFVEPVCIVDRCNRRGLRTDARSDAGR
jgi:hypothetical protein